MLPEPRLEAEGVVVRRGERITVAGVDLSASSGELVAIVGPNGAGKTTLLKALLGLLPYEGSVRIEGRELAELGPRERARRLAYVPQLSKLDSALDVAAVVRQGRYGASTKEADAAAEAAMARTMTAAFARRSFPSLSLGEQRRVLLARALASGARTILLDEPDAFLDVGQALDLFALLAALRDDGCALVTVLHDLDRAHRFADRVLVLHEGRTIASGPPDLALTALALAQSFGVEAIPQGALGYRRVRAAEQS